MLVKLATWRERKERGERERRERAKQERIRCRDSRWGQPTFVVEPVRYLVSDDYPDPSVVERLGEVLAVEQGLEDAGREDWKKKPFTYI